MLPYTSPSYFALAFLLAVPAVVLGLQGRRAGWWTLAASLAMLGVHVGTQSNVVDGVAINDLWMVAGYLVVQWVVARIFLQFRARHATPWGIGVALIPALAPLLLVKFMAVQDPGAGIGFLGISYLTFRVLDVLVGIHDRLITVLPPGRYLGYLLFFPTASAGPIDRYRRFLRDEETPRGRREFLADLDEGSALLFRGLFYKFVLAAVIQLRWLGPASVGRGLGSIVSYTYAYSAYLFFDFAGYSALAIGVGRCFGIRVPPNFDRPFLAGDIVEFWNRWHISLSTWLRDHVYMRVVLLASRKRWFRSRYSGAYLGYVITFLLMGVWHGLRWYFLLYGAYHAALFIGHSLVKRWTQGRSSLRDSAAWHWVGRMATVNAVCLGFLIFSGHLEELHSGAATAARTGRRVRPLVLAGPDSGLPRPERELPGISVSHCQTPRHGVMFHTGFPTGLPDTPCSRPTLPIPATTIR